MQIYLHATRHILFIVHDVDTSVNSFYSQPIWNVLRFHSKGDTIRNPWKESISCASFRMQSTRSIHMVNETRKRIMQLFRERGNYEKGLWHQNQMSLLRLCNWKSNFSRSLKNFGSNFQFGHVSYHSKAIHTKEKEAKHSLCIGPQNEKVDKLSYRFICHCLWLRYGHVSFWRQFMLAIIINVFIKTQKEQKQHWERKESTNKWAECP